MDIYSIPSHPLHNDCGRPNGHLAAYRCVPIAFEPAAQPNVCVPKLVITGDFFQLPPVTQNKDEPFFAFQSSEWNKCIEHTITLTHVFRQRDHGLSLIFPQP